MKKNLYTLSLALTLAITSQSAFAIEQNCQCPCHLQSQINGIKTIQYQKNLESDLAKQRLIIYNAVNLTASQRAQAMTLDNKTLEESSPYMEKIVEAQALLNEATCQGASKSEIKKAQKNLELANKDLDKFLATKKCEFKKILTRQQCQKYRKIEHSFKEDKKLTKFCNKKVKFETKRKCNCKKNKGQL